MIVRIQRRETPFVIVDKRPLNDARLSLKAKGLLVYLLSKPNNWQVMIADLVNQSADGTDAVRSALKELEKHGYARLETAREGTKVVGKGWVIFELPGECLATGDEPDQDILGKVYVSKPFKDGIVKIGFTANPAKRAIQLRSRFGIEGFLRLYDGSLAHERLIHRALLSYRVLGHGEECYRLPAEEFARMELAFDASVSAGLMGFAGVFAQRQIPHRAETPHRENPSVGKSDASNKEESSKKEEISTAAAGELFGAPEPKASPLPPTLSTPEHLEAWAAFEEMRKKKRAPITPAAKARIVQDLLAWGPELAKIALWTSVRNSWTDVYPPRPNGSGKTTTTNTTTNGAELPKKKLTAADAL